MERREFITLLGGAVGWPCAARAQQTERARRIGVLMQYSEGDPEGQIRVKALEQTLRKLGWTEGKNLRVDYRWAGGDDDRFRSHAAELVRFGEDAIVAVSTPAVKALQRETRTIPIVFTQVSDPVSQDIVENMARPSGVVTGFTNYDPAISGKWLELLKEAAPSVRRAAIVFNPKTAPYATLYVRALEALAPSVAVEVTTAPVHDPAEFEVAFGRHGREQHDGRSMLEPADFRALGEVGTARNDIAPDSTSRFIGTRRAIDSFEWRMSSSDTRFPLFRDMR